VGPTPEVDDESRLGQNGPTANDYLIWKKPRLVMCVILRADLSHSAEGSQKAANCREVPRTDPERRLRGFQANRDFSRAGELQHVLQRLCVVST
jgi:hypothetical protein